MKLTRSILIIILGAAVTACGRYGDPLMPEAYSPQNVQELKVTTDATGVSFNWNAPDDDQRDRELETIDGYYIYRQPLVGFERLLDAEAKFEKIATVEDTHLLERDRLRKEAIASGKVGRNVDVEDTLKSFAFTDNTPEPGFSYVYKIVPYNQGGVEGLVKNYVKVKFLGTASLVVVDESPEASPQLVITPY